MKQIVDIYFDKDILFDNFIIEFAKRILPSFEGFFGLNLADRIGIIMSELRKYHNPLILVENYENISEGLISGSPTEDEKMIHNFMEELPSNVHIIATSRNRNSFSGEKVYQIFGDELMDEEACGSDTLISE